MDSAVTDVEEIAKKVSAATKKVKTARKAQAAQQEKIARMAAAASQVAIVESKQHQKKPEAEQKKSQKRAREESKECDQPPPALTGSAEMLQHWGSIEAACAPWHWPSVDKENGKRNLPVTPAFSCFFSFFSRK